MNKEFPVANLFGDLSKPYTWHINSAGDEFRYIDNLGPAVSIALLVKKCANNTYRIHSVLSPNTVPERKFFTMSFHDDVSVIEALRTIEVILRLEN